MGPFNGTFMCPFSAVSPKVTHLVLPLLKVYDSLGSLTWLEKYMFVPDSSSKTRVLVYRGWFYFISEVIFANNQWLGNNFNMKMVYQSG